MFSQTYSNLNMMLNKNDDVKRNINKICEQPFYLPELTPELKVSKTLFFLNPGITQDSRVTPGLPLGYPWFRKPDIGLGLVSITVVDANDS